MDFFNKKRRFLRLPFTQRKLIPSVKTVNITFGTVKKALIVQNRKSDPTKNDPFNIPPHLAPDPLLLLHLHRHDLFVLRVQRQLVPSHHLRAGVRVPPGGRVRAVLRGGAAEEEEGGDGDQGGGPQGHGLECEQ